MEELATLGEQRPERTESERHEIAKRMASHLPKLISPVHVSNEDLYAMRAAFIKRYDDNLPASEALMAVAIIGYRMALRDAALKARAHKGGTE